MHSLRLGIGWNGRRMTLAKTPALGWTPTLARMPAIALMSSLALRSGLTLRLGLALLSVLSLACAPAEQQKSPLAPYATATLTAGVGLGDLHLDRTTLGSVVQRLGVEKVSPLASEQVALELSYEQGQLSLLFVIEPGCMDRLKTGLRPAAAELTAFLAKNPCVRESTLSSISVRSGASVDASFYEGATESGVRLWDPMQAASRHGTPGSAPKTVVAGLDLSNPEGELHFKPGITFYYPQTAGAAPGQTLIQRITIYR